MGTGKILGEDKILLILFSNKKYITLLDLNEGDLVGYTEHLGMLKKLWMRN